MKIFTSWYSQHKSQFWYFIAGVGIALFSMWINDSLERQREYATIEHLQDSMVKLEAITLTTQGLVIKQSETSVKTEAVIPLMQKQIDSNTERITILEANKNK